MRGIRHLRVTGEGPVTSSASDDPLLGYRDISIRTGVSEATLRNYRRRGYLPEPDLMLADRPRWHLSTIVEWERRRAVGANEARHP